MEIVVLSIILFGSFALFISQAVRLEIVSLTIIAALAFSGILDIGEALSGFSSPATLTVAAMMILSTGLVKSGVVDYISAFLEKRAGQGQLRVLLGLGLISCLFSAFMNNTAIVALMIPVALTLSFRSNISPSRFLLPLSYFAILGGTCTLIGTSTNILVDSLYRTSGGPGFGMFEFTLMGLSYSLIGGVYILLFSKRLPDRPSLNQLLSRHTRSKFVTEIIVPAGSRLIGRTIQEVFSGANEARVLEVIRAEEAIVKPGNQERILESDTLLLEASARVVNNLISREEVDHGTAVADDERVTISRLDLMITEMVITPNSRFIGQQIKNMGLSRRYGIHVLAVRRLGGDHHIYKLRNLSLHSGDVLLVQGQPDSLESLQESGDVLLIEGIERTLTFPRKAPVAIIILGAVVFAAAVGLAPIVFLAFAGVVLMLLSRCLSIAQATDALDSSVLLLLIGTIPLGLAMEKTGLASNIATSVVELTAPYGTLIMVSCFYLMTSLLTEVISNNAAAVLLTPIGLGIAMGAGINPKTILIAIAFGASASFATPIGYQTNTLVMGPGGYVFKDYLKFGLPMNILLWLAATVLIPIFWPI